MRAERFRMRTQRQVTPLLTVLTLVWIQLPERRRSRLTSAAGTVHQTLKPAERQQDLQQGERGHVHERRLHFRRLSPSLLRLKGNGSAGWPATFDPDVQLLHFKIKARVGEFKPNTPWAASHWSTDSVFHFEAWVTWHHIHTTACSTGVLNSQGRHQNVSRRQETSAETYM